MIQCQQTSMFHGQYIQLAHAISLDPVPQTAFMLFSGNCNPTILIVFFCFFLVGGGVLFLFRLN